MNGSQVLLSLFRKAFLDHPIKSGYLIIIILAGLIFFKELNTDVYLFMVSLTYNIRM